MSRIPAASEVMADNDRVRVTRWRLPPNGGGTGWHVHALDYVITPIIGGALTIENPGGETLECPREEGLMMMRSCRENIALPAINISPFARWGLLQRRREAAETRKLAQTFNLAPLQPALAAECFSGGNQQKIMLAKCQTRPADVFIFDEPTVGVDVGARAELQGADITEENALAHFFDREAA